MALSNEATVTVSIPAHDQKVVVARSGIPGCAAATVAAWDAVKDDDDPTFAAASGDFQSQLLHHAEAVYTTGAVMTGDTKLALFEREVAKVKASQLKAAKEEAKAIVVAKEAKETKGKGKK